MRRLFVVAAIAVLSASALGCTRPSESDCKKAITNIRQLHGNESGDTDGFQAAVRSCQGSANRESVKCFIKAQNLAELKECEGDLYEKMFGKQEAPTAPAPTPEGPPPAAPTPAAPTPAAPTPEAPTPEPPAAPDTAAPPPAAPDTAAPPPVTPDTAAPPPATPAP